MIIDGKRTADKSTFSDEEVEFLNTILKISGLESKYGIADPTLNYRQDEKLLHPKTDDRIVVKHWQLENGKIIQYAIQDLRDGIKWIDESITTEIYNSFTKEYQKRYDIFLRRFHIVSNRIKERKRDDLFSFVPLDERKELFFKMDSIISYLRDMEAKDEWKHGIVRIMKKYQQKPGIEAGIKDEDFMELALIFRNCIEMTI